MQAKKEGKPFKLNDNVQEMTERVQQEYIFNLEGFKKVKKL